MNVHLPKPRFIRKSMQQKVSAYITLTAELIAGVDDLLDSRKKDQDGASARVFVITLDDVKQDFLDQIQINHLEVVHGQ